MLVANKSAFDPTQPHGIAQAARKMFLIFAVRIHFDNAGANVFLFFTRVTTAAHRNVDLSVTTNGNRTSQMPAAVLVIQTIVRKSSEHFRLAVGAVSPFVKR